MSTTVSTPPLVADLPELCTVQEAASVLRVSRRSAYDMLRSGELPGIRLRGAWRIPRHALARIVSGDA